MKAPPNRRLRVLAAVTYAAMVLCLLVLAMVARDEFGYSLIPAFYLTFPTSYYIAKHSNYLTAILLGGAINTVIVFSLLSGISAWRRKRGS